MERTENNNNSNRLSDGLIRQNIVLMSGIAIAPVAVVATNFMNALALTSGFTVIAFLSVFACYFIPRKLSYTIRVIIYALIAGASVIPAYLMVGYFYGGEMLETLGVYLPILAVNPLILTKTETRFRLRKPHLMLLELSGYVTGFNVICMGVGIIRDILTNRQIGSLPVDLGFEIPAVNATFGGLIMVGILGGIFRWQYNQAKLRKIAKLEKEIEMQKLLENL
ncbi:MAG: hypothetical protein FWF76_00390 [Oscillospiraceae bacterium]|nr:hypothetical protein [Oscillospiraceae bacterium]